MPSLCDVDSSFENCIRSMQESNNSNNGKSTPNAINLADFFAANWIPRISFRVMTICKIEKYNFCSWVVYIYGSVLAVLG
jgi:hypothetical protein